MDQTTVASIYLGSVGGPETYLRALLMLVEFTKNLLNKTPISQDSKSIELEQLSKIFY
jgi:hypothetical protein